MKSRMRISGSWAAVGALALCVVIPASAQVAPPEHDSRGDNAPHYVDHADYDPQPYYVDGVEYKPYVPEKKKAKPASDTVKAASVPETPGGSEPVVLHPYAPTSQSNSVSAASPSKAALPAAPVTTAQAQSSDTSSSSYAPKKRARYAVAVIEALDKITAEHVKFEAPIGQPVRYKGLIYTVKACETTADDEPQFDVIAYMSVRTNPVSATNTSPFTKSKEIFHGWTFASTPSLNPLKHPNYDAWVVACRKPLQPVAG